MHELVNPIRETVCDLFSHHPWTTFRPLPFALQGLSSASKVSLMCRKAARLASSFLVSLHNHLTDATSLASGISSLCVFAKRSFSLQFQVTCLRAS